MLSWGPKAVLGSKVSARAGCPALCMGLDGFPTSLPACITPAPIAHPYGLTMHPEPKPGVLQEGQASCGDSVTSLGWGTTSFISRLESPVRDGIPLPTARPTPMAWKWRWGPALGWSGVQGGLVLRGCPVCSSSKPLLLPGAPCSGRGRGAQPAAPIPGQGAWPAPPSPGQATHSRCWPRARRRTVISCRSARGSPLHHGSAGCLRRCHVCTRAGGKPGARAAAGIRMWACLFFCSG